MRRGVGKCVEVWLMPAPAALVALQSLQTVDQGVGEYPLTATAMTEKLFPLLLVVRWLLDSLLAASLLEG